MINEQQQQQYDALTQGAGFVELPPRCQINFTGNDRVKFLNNFCTADIEKLPEGGATETFILDRRGKTTAFGHVLKLSLIHI